MTGRWVEAKTAVTVWCHSRKTPGGAATGLQDKAALVSQHQRVRAWALVSSATCFTRYNESLFTNQEGKRAHGEYATHTHTVVYLPWTGCFQVEEVGPGTNRIREMGLLQKKGQSKEPRKIMDTMLLLFKMRSRYNGHSITFFKNVWH